MHPAKRAELLIEALHKKIEEEGGQKPEHVANVLAEAQVFAFLAIADAIGSLGSDIREAGRDVSTELGGISTSSLLSDAPTFVIEQSE